ncbi:L-lactate dehydrogenase [Brachyspira catarrhinii]|uniref:L-lactate dehydrogenase n=1 Tax=Brachyspira catarrhinii TaxID=2528966 RepID=A0ABY2TU60_9SPIR|nr:L-lactate dehydrogenase [Brachyspira catarrhinii]TKZ36411.1 L-lactate dehydrogenase [Brachyspira catarrhinii]
MNIQKCAIIGAGGVGSTTAFTLVQSGLFNEIVIIDVNKNKAEGEALDIAHGIQFTNPVNIYSGDYKDLADAYLVIVTAGANQMPGESRIDLINKNASIFKKIIPSITEYNKDCILLIVSNPVDILTMLALELSGFPKERVLGSGTVLDTSRLRYLLSKKLEIDSKNIHAFIIGEHGDSELAVWSNADIAGVHIEDYCKNIFDSCDINLEEILNEVRNSAYHIIEKKGSTFYGVAMAVKRIAQAIIRDEYSILPVSHFLNGEYGIKDVCLGIPSLICRKGVKRIIPINLNENEKTYLTKSANTLKEAYKSIKK